MRVTRWGQSAYETDADLALEADAARTLGMDFDRHPDVATRPDLAGTDILVVTSKVRVDAHVLDALRGTRVLTTTSGTDHLDVPAAVARGIWLGRCPLARRDAVVEHALGMLIALSKAWPAQLEAARQGRWVRSELPALSPLGLRGSTVAVVGMGVIGTQMARVLQTLNVEVLPVDPGHDGSVALPEALERADAVTLHCALTSTSDDLLNVAALARLRPHAVVVNTARGPSLDLAAAVEAVDAGRLRGVGADVFTTEPWPKLAEHSRPSVWLTPHGAGFAPDLGRRVATEVADALGAVSVGAPFPHPVGH